MTVGHYNITTVGHDREGRIIVDVRESGGTFRFVEPKRGTRDFTALRNAYDNNPAIEPCPMPRGHLMFKEASGIAAGTVQPNLPCTVIR